MQEKEGGGEVKVQGQEEAMAMVTPEGADSYGDHIAFLQR